MSCNWDIIGEAGFQFFGKMNASLSHEIKNVLAIMNEHVGLLSDLLLMTQKGRPADPARFNILAGKIVEQIRRADQIVKNMNRFAHSVDEPLQRIDLREALDLVIALSRRLAAMRGMSMKLKLPVEPVTIATNLFFLEMLIWMCLQFAMDVAGKDETLGLILEKAENGAKIRFAGIQGLIGVPMDKFPSEPGKALLSALNADFMAEFQTGEFIICLPEDIGR